MTSALFTNGPQIDVAVIGGGPAGLAAATSLKHAGVGRVVLLEREGVAGGVPRHCGHPPFGMREFKRILRGPVYAARLVERARQSGVEIHTNASVVEALPGGALVVATPAGVDHVSARRVIYATGVRETARAARLMSGARVAGVMNTGTLQSMVYLKNLRPFRRPVIIGSELVAFSAIMTCRHAGMQPVAMIEANAAVTARWPSAAYPQLTGVALLTGTSVVEILGDKIVTGVMVQGPGGAPRHIECDGVILSGEFIPEASLALCGHLDVDPGTQGPVVDQWGRCSDGAYFAAGNVLRPVETAGWSWNEGRQAGEWVARDLVGKLPTAGSVMTLEMADPRLKFCMPQKITLPYPKPFLGSFTHQGMGDLQMRVTQSVTGELRARVGPDTIWSRKINVHPERRILIPISKIVSGSSPAVTFEIREH